MHAILVEQENMTAPTTARMASRARRVIGIGAPAVVALITLLAASGVAEAQSLRGSGASLDRQNRQATMHDYTSLRDAGHVQRFLDAGLLVPLYETANYWLKGVSFPVARPAVRLFIDRLAGQYRAACGERLVVTSLTRPLANQPRNASRRSVHPKGMALDLRRPYPALEEVGDPIGNLKQGGDIWERRLVREPRDQRGGGDRRKPVQQRDPQVDDRIRVR